MKLCRIETPEGVHVGLVTARGIIDAAKAGMPLGMEHVITGLGHGRLRLYGEDESLPVVENPHFANVVERPGKILCVGLNYKKHTEGIHMQLPEHPVLFSKFPDALVPSGAKVSLPAWETSYDYEAELVIVIGMTAWGVSVEEAKKCIFGYTCGNDLSCRSAQMLTSQWLIGKDMPGFGPCGPYIVTADEFDPDEPHAIRSYVNGKLRQDGLSTDMIFSCAEIVSFASHYVRLQPGDLIFTGTPSGVALEQREDKRRWIEPGDVIRVEIEGIGTLLTEMTD